VCGGGGSEKGWGGGVLTTMRLTFLSSDSPIRQPNEAGGTPVTHTYALKSSAERMAYRRRWAHLEGETHTRSQRGMPMSTDCPPALCSTTLALGKLR
jgi:hypothetical protein